MAKTLESFVRNLSEASPAPIQKEIVTPFPFPEEIDVQNWFDKKGMYKLFSKTPRTAFYFRSDTCNGDGIKVEEICPDAAPDRHVVEVTYMTSSIVMSTETDISDPHQLHWLVCRTEYYPRLGRVFDALAGKEEIPKGKRKPVPITGMRPAELAAFLGVPEDRLFSDVTSVSFSRYGRRMSTP
ncbi:MAG: hypothetical protein GYA24_13015 [Candidatus Lokiarchaeota archaeon]|nr:hypothetical protein [Candidatus Lokiarchaeota archaeon]